LGDINKIGGQWPPIPTTLDQLPTVRIPVRIVLLLIVPLHVCIWIAGRSLPRIGIDVPRVTEVVAWVLVGARAPVGANIRSVSALVSSHVFVGDNY